MIMRPGQPLLLPANPLFIWGSLFVALMVNMLPMGRTPWMPDLVALALVFWSVSFMSWKLARSTKRWFWVGTQSRRPKYTVLVFSMG